MALLITHNAINHLHHKVSHEQLIARAIALLEKIPHSLIAFLARFSIAAVFLNPAKPNRRAGH